MTPGMETLGQRWRQIRFNPLRSLTPERLASALDSHAAGWLREAALIFETIEQREAIVRSVMTKRRAAVARRDWQVVIPDPDAPNAEAHKETLEHFYNNLTVTDATDLNVRTGMSGLLRQMMDSIIQRYAVHEIIWKPGPGGLTAELRRVPLYFFENRSGKLRFTGPENRADGVPLDEDGWMITVADGLGEALSICWMFKRLGIQDLLSFSEKFSVPGVIGRTSAKKDSTEGIAMRDSVLAYASEWVGCIYGDDGAIKDPISVIQTPSGANLPPMTIAEYFDRMIATLVRGGDLSTISRKDSTGANPQEDETAALLEDDCALVSETLQTQLDRLVIRMVHGDETPAAYIVVNPPETTDAKREIEIDEALLRLGVKQDPEDLAEKYGREMMEDQETGDGGQGSGEEEEVNRKAAEAAKGREGEEEEIEAENYDTDQARAPKGSPDGGKWTKAGGSTENPAMPTHKNNEAGVAPGSGNQELTTLSDIIANGGKKPDGTWFVNYFEDPVSTESRRNQSIAKTRESLQAAFDEMGLEYLHDKSRKSDSEYLEVRIGDNEDEPSNWFKIRMSDHDLPAKYLDDSDYIVGNRISGENGGWGAHWTSAVKEVAQKSGKPLPASAKSVLTRFSKEDSLKKADSGISRIRFEQQSREKAAATSAALSAGRQAMPDLSAKESDIIRQLEAKSPDGYGNLISGQARKDLKLKLNQLRVKIAGNQAVNDSAANEPEPIGLDAPYFQADALRAALTADLQPLGEALAGALQAGDGAAFQGALKKISARMPEFMESPELEDLMASEFVKALTQEDPKS